MSNSNYPPDMEPVPDEHQFFNELADLIEEYDDEIDRERLFYALRDFSNNWLETLHMTGQTW